MKIINFIASAVALFATTTPQLVTAQRIVSRTGGVRGLSNSDETKEMMGKIMNIIANMHPEESEGEVNDIVERMLSNDKTMESIAKLKDALSSVDMSEMINTVVEHNNNGRHLQQEDLSSVIIAILEVYLPNGLILTGNPIFIMFCTTNISNISTQRGRSLCFCCNGRSRRSYASCKRTRW